MARLRLAVIGTGGRWRRWNAALRSLRGEAKVAGVHGPGEGDAPGVIDLIRRPDVDAVFLGEAWFGAWPLAHALEVGKPVFCAIPPGDLAGLSGRVTFCPCPALDFAAGPFVEILPSLGPVRLLQMSVVRPGGNPLGDARLPQLLLLTASILGEPEQVQMLGDDPASLLLSHPGGWTQLSLWGGATLSGCTIRAEADAGSASLELPGRLEWRDGAARHARHLPSRMAEVAALEAFFREVREGAEMPGLERTRRALGWMARAGGGSIGVDEGGRPDGEQGDGAARR